MGNKDVQMLKVKKKNVTVLHCMQAHTSTVMVSQLALSSETQIAYLCQGEPLKAKQNTASGYKNIHSALIKWNGRLFIIQMRIKKVDQK